MIKSDIFPVGCWYIGNKKASFTVWAPKAEQVDVEFTAVNRIVPLTYADLGYWRGVIGEVEPGSPYKYRLNQSCSLPDPASFYQQYGVHQPSVVVNHGGFHWADHKWANLPLESYIVYEIHVGTFTPEGTFDAVIDKLGYLSDLGINALQIMPVAQFPGNRNWGYDGTYPFAVQNSYGGPDGLKRLVNACHSYGIATALDVVYNHFGPEGNYSGMFGYYTTPKHHTPWGDAVNYDDEYSFAVRSFVIQNALYWFQEYHIDALRIDAIHGIFDMSAKHILEDLAEHTKTLSKDLDKPLYLIAESDLNDARVIREKAQGGYGIHAQWNDDFHHALHAVLTGEKTGYYADFGTIDNLVKAIREGFVYSWEYSVYRKRFFGSSSKDIPAQKFVAYIQNHDQTGNRHSGDRLSALVSYEALKLAAGALITSPFIPLLFMGEEYGEESPFLYFISHSDEHLINAVREGRKKDFKSFGWTTEPPDPQSESAFEHSKLYWDRLSQTRNKALHEYYQALLELRKKLTALSILTKKKLHVERIPDTAVVLMHRWDEAKHVLVLMNFSNQDYSITLEQAQETSIKLLDSYEECWMASGSGISSTVGVGQRITVKPYHFLIFMTESREHDDQ
ncbi:MAG: malto-oligosyltrehalose trehalohydrolase [Candidatus Auribacterota bacterium]